MSERMLLPTTVVDWVLSTGIQWVVHRESFDYSHSARVRIAHPQPGSWLSKWLSEAMVSI